jgi:hypothetical protein
LPETPPAAAPQRAPRQVAVLLGGFRKGSK